MNILMVYPEYPSTFWSFKHALKFISKKAVHPPLGLLTVASMLPDDWNKKLIDMNVRKLRDRNIRWADMVFISAMAVQRSSVQKVIKRANELGVKVVAGGPLFTASYDEFPGIDHFVLNEAEITLPMFLEDLKNGSLKKIYASDIFPDLEKTPAPSYDLINPNKYVSMSIQYSRGCPFNCEFCDITALFGRKVRTKTKEQILAELDNLYDIGWRGEVFFVDDNFIGNKNKLKEEILPALISWMKQRDYPFTFMTEASVNLSDDKRLMGLMIRAGFNSVFLGIETPDEKSLVECSKFQNKNRDLLGSIKKIQKFGFEVTAGFIVGFDNDTESIFKRQVDFIKKSNIITAMVGLLNAPKDTKLYKRLKSEGRLLENFTGDNTDFSLNFIPKMEPAKLIEGYKSIIKGIYSVRPYYKRVLKLLKSNLKNRKRPTPLKLFHIRAFIRSIFVLGIKDKGRFQYWKIFFWSLFNNPRVSLPLAITYAIYGFHFRQIFSVCL